MRERGSMRERRSASQALRAYQEERFRDTLRLLKNYITVIHNVSAVRFILGQFRSILKSRRKTTWIPLRK